MPLGSLNQIPEQRRSASCSLLAPVHQLCLYLLSSLRSVAVNSGQKPAHQGGGCVKMDDQDQTMVLCRDVVSCNLWPLVLVCHLLNAFKLFLD